MSEEDFQVIATQAENLCPVSNALRGNVEIRVEARLACWMLGEPQPKMLLLYRAV
jgi:hypothetical protein